MSRTKKLSAPKLPVEPEGSKKSNNKNPRARHLLKRFGITDEQYSELLRKQEYCCAVCGTPASRFKRRLSVDHDHKSGHIRGLLCFMCNKYIVGRHRREAGAELLRRGYEYLTAEYPGWVVPPKIKKRRKKHARRKRI